MEYSLWNVQGPALWSTNNSVARTLFTALNGGAIEEIREGIQGEVQGGMKNQLPGEIQEDFHGEMQRVIHENIPEELQTGIPSEIADIQENINTGIQTSMHVEIQNELSSGLQVCNSQAEFIAMKPSISCNGQMDLLVNNPALELDPNLISGDTDNMLKMDADSTAKKIKPDRPRRPAPSGRNMSESNSLDMTGTVLPPVDNLWNSGIVGANVNVKTEGALPVPYLDDPAKDVPVPHTSDDLGCSNILVGRLPGKHLEAMSEESEEDEDGNESVRSNSAAFGVQNVITKLSTSNHPGKVGYECGECNFMADTRPGLKRHISVVHPAPTPDANLAHALMRKLSQCSGCPITACRFRANDRLEMEAHVAKHVSEGYSIAPKKKNVPTNLQRVRYEREEYRCQICSYSCTIEKAFYKHLKVHSLGATAVVPTSTSKISCVICGKDRPTEADMKKHMRKHRDNRYFCCDICVFRTVQLKKLIQHRRMHTGEKPHLCPHCPYRSARRDNLRSHVRRVHKKENLFCDTFSPRSLLEPAVSSPSGNQD